LLSPKKDPPTHTYPPPPPPNTTIIFSSSIIFPWLSPIVSADLFHEVLVATQSRSQLQNGGF
jgi:hypothetical protein